MNCVTKLAHFDKSGTKKLQGSRACFADFRFFIRFFIVLSDLPAETSYGLQRRWCMLIGKAELDLEYNQLLITKGLQHCFISL